MAETPDRHQLEAMPDELQEPGSNTPGHDLSPANLNAREDTELADLRQEYHRATSYHQGTSTVSSRPTGLVGSAKYSIFKFWKHQISVTVAHEACRDHLGKMIPTFDSYSKSPHQYLRTLSIPPPVLWPSFPEKSCYLI